MRSLWCLVVVGYLGLPLLMLAVIFAVLVVSSPVSASEPPDWLVDLWEAELKEAQVAVSEAYEATAGKRDALNQAIAAGDNVLRDSLVLDLQEASADISYKQGVYFQRYKNFDNYCMAHYSKGLLEVFSLKGVPLPGYFDAAITIMFFRETVSHDGWGYAISEVGVSALPDIHQVVGFACMGGLLYGWGALEQIEQIQDEVAEWKEKVRAAMQVTDHTKRETRAAFLTQDIDGMKATKQSFEDGDVFEGKSQLLKELEIGIFELERVRDFYHFYGDVTNDGKIDGDDAEVIDEHFGQTVPVGTSGDITEDGYVGLEDFLIVSDRFGLSIW